jgi:RNA polymerase sigma-70 factor (ECF subfamily)
MTSPELGHTTKASWHRFLDVYEPLRPELYQYCRYLTRSPWDAEDLVQDSLARAFVTLACMAVQPPNPRAWLFRVASNWWINQRRGHREHLPVASEATTVPEPRAAREAAGTPRSRRCSTGSSRVDRARGVSQPPRHDHADRGE